MKLQTLGNRIQLKIEKPTAGVLTTDNMKAAREIGEVVGLGDNVTLPLKVGDRVMFKAWSVDIITHEGENYYFIAQDTNGICAIIK